MPDYAYKYEIHFVRKDKAGEEELIHVFNGPHYAAMFAPGKKLDVVLEQLEPTAADRNIVRLKFTFTG
jgi:hypothetical protein